MSDVERTEEKLKEVQEKAAGLLGALEKTMCGLKLQAEVAKAKQISVFKQNAYMFALQRPPLEIVTALDRHVHAASVAHTAGAWLKEELEALGEELVALGRKKPEADE